MDNFQSIEDKLSRLIPSSVSEEGQAGLDETVDRLASTSFDLGHDDSEVKVQSKSPKNSSKWQWKAAAAVALLVAPAVMIQINDRGVDSSVVSHQSSGTVLAIVDLVVIKTTNRINGREDDGLIIPEDGGAPHYRYRYHVTDEEQVRDAETGTIITLSQPRQEVVTIPVTQF